MDPVIFFLEEGLLPEEKTEVKKYGRRPLNIGFLRGKSCINAPIGARIYYAFI